MKEFIFKFTRGERETLFCLVENEIKSDLDYLNDVEGEEREHFKEHIKELKNILKKLK